MKYEEARKKRNEYVHDRRGYCLGAITLIFILLTITIDYVLTISNNVIVLLGIVFANLISLLFFIITVFLLSKYENRKTKEFFKKFPVEAEILRKTNIRRTS